MKKQTEKKIEKIKKRNIPKKNRPPAAVDNVDGAWRWGVYLDLMMVHVGHGF